MTTDKEAELYKVFTDNISIKETEHGLFIETYGRIDAETQMGTCRYGQFYPKSVNAAEAERRFLSFYWPMNLQDNGLEVREDHDNCDCDHCAMATTPDR